MPISDQTESSSLFDLSEMVIGITGGAGHLGRVMALGLAQAGATVCILGRTKNKLEEVRAALLSNTKGKGDILVFPCDITQRDQGDRTVELIVKKTGQIDGWVNNAYSGNSEQLFELSRDGITQVLSHVTDVMLLSQSVARCMIQKNRGSIVNISSIYGVVSPNPEVYRDAPQSHNPPAYGAAKAALLQFTRTLATHLASNNIRVNAIVPGPFPKPDIQKNAPFMQALKTRIPLNRIGEPKDLVGSVHFLLSRASEFVTGHSLVVDGGWTSW